MTAGFLLTTNVTRMFDTRISFTFFDDAASFVFRAVRMGIPGRKYAGSRSKCVKGGASGAQDAPRAQWKGRHKYPVLVLSATSIAHHHDMYQKVREIGSMEIATSSFRSKDVRCSKHK